MIKTYKIINIYHSGFHAPRGRIKVGYKYEYRKNRVYKVDTDLRDPIVGGIIFKACGTHQNICTTEFVKEYDLGEYHYIETLNSIYELEGITDDKLPELRSAMVQE